MSTFLYCGACGQKHPVPIIGPVPERCTHCQSEADEWTTTPPYRLNVQDRRFLRSLRITAAMLGLVIAANGCSHHQPPPVRPTVGITRYSLPADAKDDDQFCVWIELGPTVDGTDIGRWCRPVRDIRAWMVGQRSAY